MSKNNKNFNLSENSFLFDFISKELFLHNPKNWNFISYFLKKYKFPNQSFNDLHSISDVRNFIQSLDYIQNQSSRHPLSSTHGSSSNSLSAIPFSKLNSYLDNIEFYQNELNKFNSNKIELTYYQIFGLLFTEYYLDSYFNDSYNLKKRYADYLIQELNLQNNYSFDENGNLIFSSDSLKSKNWKKSISTNNLSEEEIQKREEFEMLNNLLKFKNKLVFWMATGSWKTFMMMINLLQYLKYAKEFGTSHQKVDNIIIIAPNSDLLDQHKWEFTKSWILNSSLIDKDKVQFVEITKLKMNKDGSSYTTKNWGKEWTFDAIDEYGDTNNLILIDEWHKSIQWGKDSSVQKRIRDLIWIKENSFTFEYSATYWQAVSNSDEFIQSEYSNSIIWNYSYKFFKDDNYGKNFVLNNVSDKSSKSISDDSELNEEQMIKILLSHVQQSLIFDSYKNNPQFKDYNIEKPLISIFWQKVQNKWKNKDWGKASESDELDVSEVNQFINFLWKVLQDKIDISYIQEVLSDNAVSLFTKSNSSTDLNKDIDFSDLQRRIKDKKWILNDSLFYWKDEQYILKYLILKYVFEIESKTISDILDKWESLFLEVEKMKNNDLKEIWLRVSWQNDYFWLVYVWNPDDVINWITSLKESYIKEWTENNFRTQYDSLFKEINQWKLSMIIWSKKFIMWWNNYRVSTMWLLEIWKWQGPTIIQVLWRWVRLKWKNNSLKREISPKIEIYNDTTKSFEEINISLLQSLNIIGINANFMDVFTKQLEEEWITENIRIPVKTIKWNIPNTLKILVPSKDSKLKLEKESITIDIDSFKKLKDYLDNKKDFENDIKQDKSQRKEQDKSTFNKEMVYEILSSLKIEYDERIKKSQYLDWKLVYTPEHETQFDFWKFMQSLESKENGKFIDFINWNKIYLDLIEFKQNKKELNNVFIKIRNEKEDIFSLLQSISWIKEDENWNKTDQWINLTIFLKEQVNFIQKIDSSWNQYFEDISNFINIKNINKIEKLILFILKQLYIKVQEKLRVQVEETTLKIETINDVDNSNYKFIPEQFIEIDVKDKDLKDLELIEKELTNQVNSLIDKTVTTLAEIKWNTANLDKLELENIKSFYSPLFWFSSDRVQESSIIKTIPVALNSWEYNFVKGYEEYIKNNQESFKDYEIYILRNQSKQGFGFYWNYGWFYPDFIIWKVNKLNWKQQVHFIDPKWMVNLWKESDKVKLWNKLEDFSTEEFKVTSWLYSYNSTERELRDLWIKTYGISETPRNEREFKERYHILFENDFNF